MAEQIGLEAVFKTSEFASGLSTYISGTKRAGDETNAMAGAINAAGGLVGGVMGGIASATMIAVTAIIAIGAAAVAAGVGLAALMLNAAGVADKIQLMSDQFGIGTEKLQELAFVGIMTDTPLGAITGSITKLTRAMYAAREGTGAQAEAFDTLGISTTNLDGSMRSQEAVFNDVIAALGKMEDPALRDGIAMTLLGRSAMELNPLIKAGAEEAAKWAEKARLMGAVVSEDVIANFDFLGDRVEAAKLALKGISMTVLSEFLPAFQGGMDVLEGWIMKLNAIIAVGLRRGDFGMMATDIGGLIGQIATDIAGALPGIMQSATTIGLAVIQGLMTALPAITVAAQSMVTTYLTYLMQAIPQLLTAGIQILQAVVTGIVSALPLLIQAAMQLVVTVITAVGAALPTLIPMILTALMSIANVLVTNIPLMINAALKLIVGLAKGIIQALPVLIPAAVKVLTTVVAAIASALPTLIPLAVQLIITLITALIGALPLFYDAGLQLLLGLILGITAALPILIAAAPVIMLAIIDALVQSIPLLVAMLPLIITALVDGLAAMQAAIIPVWTAVFMEIIPALVNALPIILAALGPLIVALFVGLWDVVVVTVTSWGLLLGPLLGTIWTAFTTWCADIVTSVTTWLASILTSFTTWAAGVINSVIAWGANLLTQMVKPFSNAKTSIQKAWESSWLAEVLDRIWIIIKTVFEKIEQFWIEKLNAIKKFWVDKWNEIVSFWQPIIASILTKLTIWFNAVKTFWEEKLNAVKTFWVTKWNEIVSFWEPIIASIKTKLTAWFATIKAYWEDKLNALKTFWSGVWNDMVNIITEKLGGFYQAGVDIVSGIWNGVQSMWGGVVQNVRSMIDQLLAEIEAALGIHSPSRVMADVGEEICRGLSIGILDNMRTPIAAAQRLVNNVRQVLSTLPAGFGYDTSGQVISGAKPPQLLTPSGDWSWMSPEDYTARVNGVWDGIIHAVSTLPAGFGYDLSGQIISGAKPPQLLTPSGDWGWMTPQDYTDRINGVWDGIIHGIEDSLGISSPSTVMANIGRRLLEGLARGIKDYMMLPVNAMAMVAASVQTAALAPAMAGGTSNSYSNITNWNVNVQGGGGMNEQDLMRALQRRELLYAR